MTEDLTLEDLAQSSGLTLRTLRFYIQEGLLPGPDTRGKNARYSREHRDRLVLIQRLKDLRLPLQEIKQILDNMTPEEVSQVSHYQDLLHLAGRRSRKIKEERLFSNPSTSSALEYIRNLETGRKSVQEILDSKKESEIKMYQMNQPPEPGISYDLPLPADEETWTRIVLSEGIELNIRVPKTLEERQMINRLVEYARRIFKKS